ncbi:MAG: ATP-binding cassette domain-containing protein [Bacteroidales bacterium]
MQTSENILIELVDVDAGYNGKAVLTSVNFKICKHDFIGVIGPNGGGKTTLVKVILGLLKTKKGKLLNHLQTSENDGQIGYLPQINNIDRTFPISVKDVVLSGFMKQRGMFQRFSRLQTEKANSLMEEMGVSHLAKKPFGELSGGQMQRTLLCRSIISSPQLLILDEPNTFVDNKFEGELYEKLRELNKTMAIVIVSHDVGMISSYVKTIACVNNKLHYHKSNIITESQLKDYNCPIQLITHGHIPHTVLDIHEHKHD